MAQGKKGTGLTGTYDGKPCKHGHGTLRYKAGGSCVRCQSEYSSKAWKAGTKKKSVYDPVYRAERNLKNNYGMTTADYERMLHEQNGGCAICGKEAWEETTGKLAVDHCHAAGHVRGLLCRDCNQGLGFFHDDPTLLDEAKVYLAKSRA